MGNDDEQQSQPQKLGFYEVESLIGRGGMASVFRGRQPSLNRTVAIKILPPQFATSPDLISRFEREGQIIGQLNHPNIAQVIDRGREDDTLYIVMEYVDGQSLDLLMRQGRLSVDQSIDYAMQICDGLEYAHAHGVIHRDLKPSNILVEGESKRIRIADFGIAQFETNAGTLATLTNASGSLGTINYMSPEQRLDSHRVDHRTDIFSFGVILYEMLTGRLPLGHFKLPSFLRPDVPILMDSIIKRCLAESPDDRYQGAGQIHDDLKMLARRQSHVASSPTGFLNRLNKRQRLRLTKGIVAGALLFIVGVAILALVKPPSRQSAAGGGVRDPAAPVELSAPAPATALHQPLAENDHTAPPAIPATSTTFPGLGGERPPEPPPATIPPISPPPALGSAMPPEPSPTAPDPADQDLAGSQPLAEAKALLKAGKAAAALPILENVLAEKPPVAVATEAHFLLASALHKSRQQERAKLEYERHLRQYPHSPRYLEAVVGKCRVEWETAPRSGPLPVKTTRLGWMPSLLATGINKAVQERLIAELEEAIRRFPAAPHTPAALRLLADIAEPPKLADFGRTVAALERLYQLDPASGPDSLYHAADLCNRKLEDPRRALKLFKRFLADFPDDPRCTKIQQEISLIEQRLPASR